MAALRGVGFTISPERVQVKFFSENLSTRLIKRNFFCVKRKSFSYRREFWKNRCSLSSKAVSPLESEDNARSALTDSLEEESGHVIRFDMSDFKLLTHVSIGLGGRADEVVYEAIVKDSSSPLYNTRVVLRQFLNAQAQRRGKRAIEVLKKLVRRRLLYHSYSMQVHGYVYSLQLAAVACLPWFMGHWLQQSDWLPTLEATLALDEESVRRVGDDTIGGPAVSRQSRIIRILMRDLLIGVNYLHSHGLAHTELRLENVHISPVDRHIKCMKRNPPGGELHLLCYKISVAHQNVLRNKRDIGNAADFYEDGPNSNTLDNCMDRRQMMIAFDMRCVGFMMAKMVLRELMDPSIFASFKSFLMKGNDPSCLREFLLRIFRRNALSGSAGLQILDRNWGAGWNLLSLLLATKPSKRIRPPVKYSILDQCGCQLGLYLTFAICTLSSYGDSKLFLHKLIPELVGVAAWKMASIICTGRHIGLTLRQPSARVLIGDVNLTVSRASDLNTSLSFTSDIGFTVIIGHDWPHDKAGIIGKMEVDSVFRLTSGRRLYLKEEKSTGRFSFGQSNNFDSLFQKLSGRKWRKAIPFKEFPSSLPVAKLASNDIEVTMNLSDPLDQNVVTARN
ncbi:hypothetical protein GH714_039922 [Hevea brasiliensis]|uniref:Protein kinase domain-containing protein n=1 Tax=Hevea brasiliensis TaxID=3981 RepID=A0A6A6MT67_HEVBR|nr:hypothetical protein GH714_039922 [Hevea brasiliensis]